jgi:hypothetical protein
MKKQSEQMSGASKELRDETWRRFPTAKPNKKWHGGSNPWDEAPACPENWYF